jgi:apolipoprotein N-acyltransferase
MLRGALLAVASGLAFAWCFAASPPPLLSLVALAPFLLTLGGEKNFRLGWLFGIAFWAGSVPWIVATIETFGGVPAGLSHFLVLLMAIYLGLDAALFAWLAGRVWRRGGIWRYLGVPSLWVVFEALRGFPFNGFLWNLAAYAWTDLPGVLQLAAWIGAFGVSFLVALANVAAARAFESRRFVAPATAWLAIVLVVCLAGRFSKAEEPTRGGGRDVRVVQPNSPISYQSEVVERNYRRLLELSKPECIGGDALLVWPESAAWPALYESSPRLRQDVAKLIEAGCRVFLSSASQQGEGWENIALLAGPGGVEGSYAKRRLVPWGEYVPLKTVLPFVGYLARNAGEFEPGTELGLVPLGAESLAPAICYEVIFPNPVAEQVKAGATMLITVTNDAWYGDTAAPWQHLRAARFRAAENRRPLLRAALTGVSAIVGPEGEVESQLGVGEEGVLRSRIRGQSGLAPFTRAPWLAVAVSALLALFAIIRSRRF